MAGGCVDKPVDGLVTDLTSSQNSFSASHISTEFILCKTFATAGGCVDKPVDGLITDLTSPRNSFAGPVVDKPVDGLVTDLTSPRNSFSARRLLRQAAMLTNRLMVWSLTNISTEFILCKMFAMAGGCVDKPIDDRSLTNISMEFILCKTCYLVCCSGSRSSLPDISMEFILCKRRATADGHLSLFRLSATFSARVSVNAWDDKGRVDYYATHIALQSGHDNLECIPHLPDAKLPPKRQHHQLQDRHAALERRVLFRFLCPNHLFTLSHHPNEASKSPSHSRSAFASANARAAASVQRFIRSRCPQSSINGQATSRKTHLIASEMLV
ncbi:hypothetical protein F4604DRAFT_1936210 [Suillus subluteus]|nr:hypothetical protein F4604DRAFT_1936210 [Suillus subluteus]